MSAFKDKVIQVTKMIPKGKVVSYGQVALMAGVPRGARQVGWILHELGEETPWWKVINNSGRISIKSPDHSPIVQKEKLEADGVSVSENLEIDIEKYRWRPAQETLDELKLPDEYIFKIMEKYQI